MSRHRIALIAVALPLLSGCGAIIDSAAESATEKAIESSGGGNVDIDRDGDSFSIETDEGTMTVDEDGAVVIETEEGTITATSGAELPDSFPAFPLPDDLVIESVSEINSDNGDIYSVGGFVAGDPPSIFDAWLSDIEGAGYAIDMRNATTSDGSFVGSAIATKGEAESVFLGLETTDGGANLQAGVTTTK